MTEGSSPRNSSCARERTLSYARLREGELVARQRPTTAERLGCSTHLWMKDVAQVHSQHPFSNAYFTATFVSHCPICSAANRAPHKAAQHYTVGPVGDGSARCGGTTAGRESGAANAGDCPGSGTLDARSAADRLCDWVHRYNELGLQNPFDRPRRNGPVIALSSESVVCRSSAARRGTAGSRPLRLLRGVSP